MADLYLGAGSLCADADFADGTTGLIPHGVGASSAGTVLNLTPLGGTKLSPLDHAVRSSSAVKVSLSVGCASAGALPTRLCSSSDSSARRASAFSNAALCLLHDAPPRRVRTHDFGSADAFASAEPLLDFAALGAGVADEEEDASSLDHMLRR